MLVLIGQEVTLRDDKARKELGYKSHISVDEGMQEISRKAKK
jgi:nucleoside-diphosphate-sugar epimerase